MISRGFSLSVTRAEGEAGVNEEKPRTTAPVHSRKSLRLARSLLTGVPTA
jgi:hypothetical protein